MRSTKVNFTGSQGTPLVARLELPDEQPRAHALFAHCFTCSKDSVAAARVSRALAAQGIAVLRFDFTGLGESGGDFGNSGFTSNIADLVHAADYLREHHVAPSLLIGHSLGGAAVLAAAASIPEARAVATIAAPSDPQHVLGLLDEAATEINTRGEADVELAGRTFRIRKEFLDDLAAQRQDERIAKLGVALLVMHSPTDAVVGIENARRIFDTARHPKSFIALDGADHLLTGRRDAEFAAAVLAGWATRYAVEAPPAHSPGEEGVVTVSENGEGPFGQTVTVGRHTFAADEPAPAGLDNGPNPYDLLLAGLGACTSMTVRMYADRKGWPLDQVAVSLRHSRIHAQDCADCETKSGRLDRFERTIRFTGDLDDDQRHRLLEIADKCPVHKTLESEVRIVTREERSFAAPER